MQNKQEILATYWGHKTFRGNQAAIIDAVLQQKDVLALLPTGGGKSICYQVPAMALEGLCLVISPLVALMKDQVENLIGRGIAAAALYSGMHYFDVQQVLQKAVQGQLKFLYVSPERLQTRVFAETLPYLDMCLLAVDEAHCISQWGYDFRPPYLQIATIKQELHKIPTIAVTASATSMVQQDIIDKLALKDVQVFRQSFARDNLSYSVFNVDSKMHKAIEILQQVSGSSIVYCKSRQMTTKVAAQLQQQGIVADYYHAGLSQEIRANKQQDWLNNKIRVMVCTNAFGMGIDKPDVQTVIHFHTPDCLENYYQEAGRAGRNGQRAYAVLLYEHRDKEELAALPDKKFPSIAAIQNVYQAIANYLHIPVGAGEGQYYDFNLLEFCQHFSIEPNLAIHTLKVLEQEGHLSFSEQVFIPAHVQFTADRFALQQVEILYPALEEVMKCLLRTYEGIYENKVAINEKLIAKLCRLPYEKVYEHLKLLHQKGIIEYTPQKETPQLYFILNRAPAKHIAIQHEQYLQRKQLYVDRLQQILQFLYLKGHCRSMFIAQYFGDTAAKPCGSCDNCIQLKAVALSPAAFAVLHKEILEVLKKGPVHLQTILLHFKQYKKDQIKTALQFLQSERRIGTTTGGLYELL